VHRNIAHFCLRAHTLRVETGCWQLDLKSTISSVKNVTCMMSRTKSMYMSFLMPFLYKCATWGGDSQNNLLTVLVGLRSRTCIGDTGAFYFDNIGAEDVKLFLLKRAYKSFLFLSETMDIFCLAGSVQQAQQSTHQAKGLTHHAMIATQIRVIVGPYW